MTYFDALSPYRYGLEPAPWPSSGPQGLTADSLYRWLWDLLQPEPAFEYPEVNVGWLDADHEFPQSEPTTEFLEALTKLAHNTEYHLMRGRHPCPFCRADIGGRLGAAEMRVRGVNVVYAAPNLICHYVANHGYQPPDEFVKAVLAPDNQAIPVPGTRRPIPTYMLTPTPWSISEVSQAVEQLLTGWHIRRLLPRLELARSSEEELVVEAALLADSALDPIEKKWLVPCSAILNIEQAAFGLATMLQASLEEQKAAYFQGRLPR